MIDTTKDTLQSEIDSLQTKLNEIDISIQNLVAAVAKGQKDEVLSIIFNNIKEFRELNSLMALPKYGIILMNG